MVTEICTSYPLTITDQLLTVNGYRLTARGLRNGAVILFITSLYSTHKITKGASIKVAQFVTAIVLSVAVIHCYGERPRQVPR